MNPFPPMDPTMAAPLGIYVPYLALVVLGMVFAAFAAVMWMARNAYRLRTRLTCPMRLRRATVVFALGPDGKPRDVEKCSLLRPYRSITCGKVCLAAAPR
jgi:hypothetical protein